MPLDSLTWTSTLALLGAGLVSGFLNTVAGGGSLLSLPVLMIAGLPADVANASNRVAILAQSAAAVHGFDQVGHLPRSSAVRALLPVLLGSAVGAAAAGSLSAEVLEPLLLGTLILFALLFALTPERPLEPVERRSPSGTVAVLAYFASGVYGGFVQAGVGFLLLATSSRALGLDLVRANAVKVALVMSLTVVALAVFIAQGLVAWAPALVMALGSVVGARAAVRLAVARVSWLRWVVLAAVLVCALWVILRSSPG